MRAGDIEVLMFTSENNVESTLASEARKLLVRAGYRKVIKVTDKEWERSETHFSLSGRNIDMRRYLQGDPRPFRHKVFEFDYEALEDAILSSRGTVLFNPFSPSRLSEPFGAGIKLICDSQRIRNAHEKLLNRYISCCAADSRKYSALDNITFDLEVTLLHNVSSLQRDPSSIPLNASILAVGISAELLDQLRRYRRRTVQKNRPAGSSVI